MFRKIVQGNPRMRLADSGLFVVRNLSITTDLIHAER